MRGLKKFLFGTAVLAGTLCLISASAFIFLMAFQYADNRRANAAVVSAPPPAESSSSVSSAISAASAPSRAPGAEEAASEGTFGTYSDGGGASSEPLSATGLSDAEKELVLVNGTHKLPEDYRPDLVKADGVEMDALTARAYREMRDAAQKDGVSLWVSSGYRSDERQGELFDREVETYGKTAGTRGEAEAFAEKSVARPGHSEHSTGLALDLNGVLDSFDGTDAFRWLDAHAPEYGFILRYPKEKQEITKIKYEPWHYRYVGVQNAEIMKEKDLCLEEYLDFIAKTGPAN